MYNSDFKFKFIKRNGNGLSWCHICNLHSWDSGFYDMYMYLNDALFIKDVICYDCMHKYFYKVDDSNGI